MSVSATPARRRNGRRPADPDGVPTQENILAVAEAVFAEHGYVAASLREIAARADVTQALIIYYFGSKQALFETLFKRRGLEVSRRRQELLDALLQRAEPPTVRELVSAYLAPQFALRQGGAGSLAFVRMQARLHHEPDELALRLRREVYDHATRNYIAALRQLVPGLDAADAHWRMTFAVGTYLYMLSGFDRLADLSGGLYNSDDTEEVVRRLTDFLVAGLTAPSTP
ncbi:TetR family transcriptional regulator [Roseomonas sp. GC11]|uniref:TetR/AcrR family transcriptional regulator n=1 Tax=Roseomonas sp. GC11 TaxID=2950546 RepID=UPI0021086CD3|nr:TetR/AcrR family transcriptional regulator [Roseomonas sp. GC11]MCQ4159271.1 TetR family transcriptional regulator [Roseomonas sp. GC11]